MSQPHINRIATALPRHEVHGAFHAFALAQAANDRDRAAFARLAERSRLGRRWSVLEPSEPLGSGTACGFYRTGGTFPSTAARMRRYEAEAPALAEAAIGGLGADLSTITHLVFATCTGFAAPGLDHHVMARFGMNPAVERTVVGFMGCQAGINALKLAWHITRSEPRARVLVLSLELCTLHLQGRRELEQLMGFLLFADGCAAAIVSAEPVGLRMEGFRSTVLQDAADLITWRIGDDGFDMTLSGMVPFTLAHAMPGFAAGMLGGEDPASVDLWAVHPGGRAILDAVAHGLALPQGALAVSEQVLRDCGNMSSATVLFVLAAQMAAGGPAGRRGCAVAFGPGLSAESMRFTTA